MKNVHLTFSFSVLLLLQGCSSPKVYDPEHPEAKSEDDLPYDQKIEMQEEIIKRQDAEIEQQKREVEDLKRQKYHNRRLQEYQGRRQ